MSRPADERIFCADCQGEGGALRIVKGLSMLGHLGYPNPIHPFRLAQGGQRVTAFRVALPEAADTRREDVANAAASNDRRSPRASSRVSTGPMPVTSNSAGSTERRDGSYPPGESPLRATRRAGPSLAGEAG